MLSECTNINQVDPPVRDSHLARARSFGYGLIAEVFRWPTPTLVRQLHDPATWKMWPDILREVYPECGEPLSRLIDLTRSLDSVSELGSLPSMATTLEHHYINLFGHTVRGACPLYELEYGQSEIIQQASFLADIAGFYAAFGLTSTTECHERQDHLTVECEFMSILAALEGHALETDEIHARKVYREAQATFLNDHLGRWLPACMRRVREAARVVDDPPESVYGLLAGFAADFLAAECNSFDVKIGPELLDLRSVDPTSDAAIRCGAEENCPGGRDDELVQIQLDPALGGGG